MARPSLRIAIDVDERQLTLAGVDIPLHLASISDQLPAVLAPMGAWLADATMQDVGASLTVRDPPDLAVFADVGPETGDPSGRIALVRIAGTIGFAVALPASADLGNTPVFGHLLTGFAIGNVRATYLSAALPGGTTLPSSLSWTGLGAARAGLGMSVDLSSSSGTTTVPLSVAPKTPTPTPRPPPLPAVATAVAPTPSVSPAPSPDAIQWVDVGQTIGPLTIGRLGFATGNALMLGLDASLQTSVLSVDLTGFVISIPNGHGGVFHIQLDGLAVDFSSASVTLAGSLVRTPLPKGEEYDGSLLLKAGPYAIAAVGSYASVDGVDSLFVFGVAAGTFGGPPAFVVTALAAGFGVNRDLRLPAPDQVLQFPLIAAAVAAAGTTKSATNGAAQTQRALAALNKDGWVPIKHGSYWLAVGVGFRSFEIVNGFALLTVSFGDELTVALLGVGALELPTAVDSAETYAYVELTLDAVLRPSQGTFSLIALLTDKSYVLDPACKLTGGFATCVWFPPNEHAGDFVVTLGGYHPSFHCDWYPVIPRLGFLWKISDLVTLSGGLYFALTPKCVMAGGNLSLTFQDGALSAWFHASADFIIYWRPFNYMAALSVSIGASYTADWAFLHKTFTIELGADVTLWGPPFAGIAHVHWFIISFTITINGGAAPTSVVLGSWDDFATASLPPPIPATQTTAAISNICRPRIATGLVATTTDSSGTDVWQLCPDGLVVVVETAIPVTTGISVSIAAEHGSATTTTTVPFTATPANVAPLGAYPLVSTLTVTLVDPQGNWHELLTGWTWTAVTANAAAALWGPGNTPLDPRDPAVPTADDMNVQAVVSVTGTAAAATRSAPVTPNAPPIDVGDRALPFPAAGPQPLAVATTAPHDEHGVSPAGDSSTAGTDDAAAAPARLRAICHRAPTARGADGRRPAFTRWHVAGPADPAATALPLPAGTTSIHAADPTRPGTVRAEGGGPLVVATVLPGHHPSVAVVPPGTTHVAPPGRWIVTTALAPGSALRRPGWDRDTSRLLQVDDHTFAGDGVVVTTQAPLRRFGRRERPAHDVVEASWVIDRNLVAGSAGDRGGHVTTTFPPGMTRVALVVVGDPRPPSVVVHAGARPGGRVAPVSMRHDLDGGGAAVWWYALDPSASCSVAAATGPGQSLRRVVAVDDEADDASLAPDMLVGSDEQPGVVRLA